MFPAQKKGEYEPVKIRRKNKPASAPAQTESAAPDPSQDNGEESKTEDESQWEEDPLTEEDSIWPIKAGQIRDWPCFYALMTHVYNSINPPFHTPVLLISEPVWTSKDHERITQFFFEKFKVPAFAIMDAAMASLYAYGVPTATVVDVGLEKADVTCIADFVLQSPGRGLAVPHCGGEAMTERLVELMNGRKGFNRDVCEQLKRSKICEILPLDASLPGDESAAEGAGNTAAAGFTGQAGGASGQRNAWVAQSSRRTGSGAQSGEGKSSEDEEGVLDIASIVARGNMSEYLAQKEREKQERAYAKSQQKTSDNAQPVTNKPARLSNAKRVRNTFVYEDFALHHAMKEAGMTSQGMADMQSALDEGPNKPEKSPEPQSATSNKAADAGLDPAVEARVGGFRREVEVGVERFQAVSGGILERLADAIHRTIYSCGDLSKRPDLWNSLIIVGNGSKIGGFKDALLDVLHRQYIISPSSATMFTSELPSSFSTPAPTGANTPLHGQPSSHHASVNPLLFAATTAQNPLQPHYPGSTPGPSPHLIQYMHSSAHGQTPTSIKLARIPEYFPEWKEYGHEEASFLGAQVAAKVLFVNDGGNSGYMTRTGYNEQGPNGIHECIL